jgi:hypothetical protein
MTATPVYPKTKRELVRLLSKEHGHKIASELSGVPYDLVRQWSSRDQRKASQSVTNPIQTAVEATREIANNVESELAENERETRLSLSRYAKRAAKDSETATLRDGKQVKAVAEVAGIVHKWGNQEKTGNQFSLNVLNINAFDVKVGERTADDTPTLEA